MAAIKGSDLLYDVIIPTYNTAKMTMECIQSVLKHNRKVHVIVVDNGDDQTKELIQSKFLNVGYIKNKNNVGYAKACNQGIYAGHAEYIIFLNSDTKMIHDGVLDVMKSVFQKNPQCAVVGPKLINDSGRIVGCGVVGSNASPKIRGWLKMDGKDKYCTEIQCISVCGACMMIKRSNIPILGMMDEHYPFYFEETDYCYNARDKGYDVIYTPLAKVIHYGGASSRDRIQTNQWFKVGQQYFDKKWSHMMEDNTIYG